MKRMLTEEEKKGCCDEIRRHVDGVISYKMNFTKTRQDIEREIVLDELSKDTNVYAFVNNEPCMTCYTMTVESYIDEDDFDMSRVTITRPDGEWGLQKPKNEKRMAAADKRVKAIYDKNNAICSELQTYVMADGLTVEQALKVCPFLKNILMPIEDDIVVAKAPPKLSRAVKKWVKEYEYV